MDKVLEWFKGKKTYVMGLLAIIGAIAGYLVGDLSMNEAISAVWAGITAMTMKAAIAKTAP